VTDFLEDLAYGVRTLLFGVGPTDVMTLASVTLLVALAASVVPAWRAMRVDPITGLRSE
jgi:putative ABC transport system permease protein